MYACRIPKKVFSGEKALEQLPALCAGAKKIAVLSDRGIQASGVLNRPLELLESAGIAYECLLDLYPEPTYTQAQAVVDAFQNSGADRIVAVGGGSVMDIAKLCSVAADTSFSIHDLLENPGLARKTVGTVMIPTTAGTGAEATPNAIVAVPEKELKVGIVCEEMIPDAVILDGEMIRRLPPAIAASTGVDALCHAIECFTSKKATPFSDLFALEALKLIFTHIERACLEKDALESKNAMLLAAFYGGVAITCSGTTAVHALSYPLGGKYHIPHGVANAMLLLPVMRFNASACREDFARIYDAMGGKVDVKNEEKTEWVLSQLERIVKRLNIPTDLKAFGVSPRDMDELVNAAMDVQRLLQNNKRCVTPDDARQIYQQLLA